MKFFCNNCFFEKQISFDLKSKYAGKNVVCPKCGAKSKVGSATAPRLVEAPPIQSPSRVSGLLSNSNDLPKNEVVVERHAVTVGEFYSLTNGLPDRDVVFRYADGTSTNQQLGKLRKALSKTQLHETIYDDSKEFVLTALRMKDGWLCLEFSSSSDSLLAEILRDEAKVTENANARDIVRTLRKIEAIVEIGITRDQLQIHVAEGWIDVKDFLDDFGDRFPQFSELVAGAYDDYKSSLELWNRGASEIPLEISGGGFGLAGAATGMALGIGVQSMINAYNNSHNAKLEDRLRVELSRSARKTDVLHNVMRSNPA